MAEFLLKLEPAERVVFVSKKFGEEPTNLSLRIGNPAKERIAFKIKCTSNELFRIRPPLGLLKTGDVASVAVTFNGGKTIPESGKHYIAIYYIKVTDDKKTSRQFWQDHKREPDGTKRLYIDFEKEDLDEKKDDKKDDEKKDDEKKDDKKEEKEEQKDDKENKNDDGKKDEKKDDEKKEEKEEKKEEKEEEREDKKEDKDEEKKDEEEKKE